MHLLCLFSRVAVTLHVTVDTRVAVATPPRVYFHVRSIFSHAWRWPTLPWLAHALLLVLQAELRTMDKLAKEEEESRVRVEEEKKKRLDAEQRRRRSVLSGV